jgi:hypothetical protein
MLFNRHLHYTLPSIAKFDKYQQTIALCSYNILIVLDQKLNSTTFHALYSFDSHMLPLLKLFAQTFKGPHVFQ